MRQRRLYLGGCLVAATAVAALGRAAGPQAALERAAAPATVARATFAGGCFWCMEAPFDKLDGVLSTTSGYTGGAVRNPSYEAVSSGRTGHTEAVQIVYDPARVGYDRLLHVFWRNVDPFDGGGQFCDRGGQYRPGIFFHGEEQRRLAEDSRREVQSRFRDKVVVEITPAAEFYPAEDYHQDYYQKNPARYRFYRFGCRRDTRLEQVWGKEAGAGDH